MKMRSMTTLSVVLACGTLASMASAVDTVRATFNSVAPNTSC
jgi:hypothetical protein